MGISWKTHRTCLQLCGKWHRDKMCMDSSRSGNLTRNFTVRTFWVSHPQTNNEKSKKKNHQLFACSYTHVTFPQPLGVGEYLTFKKNLRYLEISPSLIPLKLHHQKQRHEKRRWKTTVKWTNVSFRIRKLPHLLTGQNQVGTTGFTDHVLGDLGRGKTNRKKPKVIGSEKTKKKHTSTK